MHVISLITALGFVHSMPHLFPSNVSPFYSPRNQARVFPGVYTTNATVPYLCSHPIPVHISPRYNAFIYSAVFSLLLPGTENHAPCDENNWPLFASLAPPKLYTTIRLPYLQQQQFI